MAQPNAYVKTAMNQQFYTYLHCKPDLTPFYVGKGTGRRCYEFSGRNNHHQRIVTKYGKENIQVLIFKKDSEESAFKSEIRLIKMLRNTGFDIANYTIGGEGFKGARHSLASRAKISTALKGNKRRLGSKQSPATIAKRVEKIKGMKRTAEQCARCSAAQKGKKKSPEQIAKMIGRQASEETRAKMRKPKSAEHCKNISIAKIGKKLPPFTAEHKAKLSIANKGKAATILSDGGRKKISLSSKNREWSEESRIKMSKSAKLRWAIKRLNAGGATCSQ